MQRSNYWNETMRRRLSRRTLLRAGAFVGASLAVGGSLIGCGGKAKVGTSTPDEQPEYGGVLNFAIGGDPPNFDLISQSTYMVLMPIAPIYNNLVQYDPLDFNKIIPDLAEKWDVSSDGKTYTFHLIKGVKFHDGKPCTSADVKATFDIVRDPPKGLVSPRKGAMAAVDRIETPDENTARFVLKRPNPSLIMNLAQGWMGILPKHILQEKGSMAKDAVGTGPFMFKEYTRGVSLDLVKNPNYHIKGRPYIDGIKFFMVPDPQTVLANLRTGQIDYSYGSPTTDDAHRVAADSNGRVIVQSMPSPSFNTVNFASKKKPWDDKRVLEAVSYAIDRTEAVKVIESGYADVAGMMPANSPWALPAAELEKIPGFGKNTAANIAKAKQLLAQAGYPNGFATTMLTRKGTTYENLSIFLKDQLAKVGIDAKLDVQETAAAMDNLNKRNFDLAPWAHAIAADDPDGIFGEFYLCDSERNYSDICSKEVDDLFLKQSQTVNVEERRKIVNQMERATLLTYTKLLVLWRRRAINLSARVRNYKMNPSNYNNQRLQDVWLAKK